MKQTFELQNLDCANCAAKMEDAINHISGVKSASINFMTQKLTLEADTAHFDAVFEEVQRICARVEPGCTIVRPAPQPKTHGISLDAEQKRLLARILVTFAMLLGIQLIPLERWFGGTDLVYAQLALNLIPYLVVGYDVLLRAAKNIGRGQVFDENFLMSVATLGAFAIVIFPEAEQYFTEGVAVMLFYQIGELFQSYAVGKSRKSIADMMDIAPDYANVVRNGELVRISPEEVAIGDEIVVKPGERVPIDGTVVEGTSQLNTAALTGESAPQHVEKGDAVISGCVNLTGALTIRAAKPFSESTVSRILELVENAADKKAPVENFITRFARYYTPIVVGLAVLLAVVPPLAFGQSWAEWVERGLIFLVVSCPCALVISVPLSFFGGIGAASRMGILIKGSNYLEALSHTETVVFDKTGTLTSGSFSVVAAHAEGDASADELLALAAHAETYSDHPIALSIKAAYAGKVEQNRVTEAKEEGGHGVCAKVAGRTVLVGNAKLMAKYDIATPDCKLTGTILHVARDGAYWGYIVIADAVKDDAKEAIAALREAGVHATVMLTGDRKETAASVAAELGITEYRAQLLPQDKVVEVERLLDANAGGTGKLAFVGDGINDAPVLARADIGIAMGALGSDAAIEAADVVLMDDKPSNIAHAIILSRKTMGIVRQNIAFVLVVKFGILILAAIGMANMWLAVFGDVGVTVIAILNAMRVMRAQK